MENKCEDEHIQNSYLSSLFCRQVKIINNTVSKVQNFISPIFKKQKIIRNKTHQYIINDLSQEHLDNIKRKNSFSGCKKYRKVENYCSQTKGTPYQNRKNHERLIFKNKKQKINVQIQQLPLVLEQTKANWLVVKEATPSMNNSARFKTQPSIERVKIDLSDVISEKSDLVQQNYCGQVIAHKSRNDSKNDNERQKSIKIMLSYYRNKNIIKHNLKVNKTPNITNSEIKESINIKLSNIPQVKNSIKMSGLKDKIKNVYVSKRQLTWKPKKNFDENAVTNESLRANLLTSTHSDLTEKPTKNQLEGVLNSFKVDMKFKQKNRPKTAQRVLKTDQSHYCKSSKKNASSTKVIEMTGWQEQPDVFQRDIFFS